MISTRTAWRAVLVATLGLSQLTLPATAQTPAPKPNIMFIMGDDIGWMQLGSYQRIGLPQGQDWSAAGSADLEL